MIWKHCERSREKRASGVRCGIVVTVLSCEDEMSMWLIHDTWLLSIRWLVALQRAEKSNVWGLSPIWTSGEIREIEERVIISHQNKNTYELFKKTQVLRPTVNYFNSMLWAATNGLFFDLEIEPEAWGRAWTATLDNWQLTTDTAVPRSTSRYSRSFYSRLQYGKAHAAHPVILIFYIPSATQYPLLSSIFKENIQSIDNIKLYK